MKSDVQLQHDVVEEVEWEPSLDAAGIGVTAKEGVVTLMGHVPVYSQKFKAEEVVKRVHGVKAVANDIQVRLGDGHQPDDAGHRCGGASRLEVGRRSSGRLPTTPCGT